MSIRKIKRRKMMMMRRQLLYWGPLPCVITRDEFNAMANAAWHAAIKHAMRR